MGQQNRQRRAAKKRQRDARRRAPTPPSSSEPWAFGPQYCPEHAGASMLFPGNGQSYGSGEWNEPFDDEFDDRFDDAFGNQFGGARPAQDADVPDSLLDAVAVLGALADVVVAGDPSDRHRRVFLALAQRDQCAALDLFLHSATEQALDNGWSPLDLYELGRRRGDADTTAYLIHLCADWTRRFPAATIDARWSAQLSELVDGDTSGEPSLEQWAAGRTWSDVLATLTDLAVAVMTLPAVEPVLPRPGTTHAVATAPSGVDDAVLRRVRGLLAKAEATDFEHEAATLSAKAQELMTRHSIDSALAAAPSGPRETPQVRRVWLDAPYVRAKAVLVSEVASANRCRTVLAEKLGFVTLIGFGADLDTTDVLSTSLLVQATRAVRQGGAQRSAWGTSRTRAYRQSFLISFATRIGERLSAAVSATEYAADAERGGSLLPVLASREQEVNAAFDDAFAHLRSLSVSVSDRAGWGAGRTAADLADLTIRSQVDERSA